MSQDHQDLLHTIKTMGDPKPFGVHDVPRLDDGKIQCVCSCWKSVVDMPVINTGVVVLPSDVCSGCVEAARHDSETSRIVCIACRRIVARLAPHTDKQGFTYAAGFSYHTEKCPKCSPGLTESAIVEKLLHDWRVGRKPK